MTFKGSIKFENRNRPGADRNIVELIDPTMFSHSRGPGAPIQVEFFPEFKFGQITVVYTGMNLTSLMRPINDHITLICSTND